MELPNQDKIRTFGENIRDHSWSGLKQMNQRTKKLMTIHKALHPRDDVDKLYVTRKEGGRGFSRIEDSVDAVI